MISAMISLLRSVVTFAWIIDAPFCMRLSWSWLKDSVLLLKHAQTWTGIFQSALSKFTLSAASFGYLNMPASAANGCKCRLRQSPFPKKQEPRICSMLLRV